MSFMLACLGSSQHLTTRVLHCLQLGLLVAAERVLYDALMQVGTYMMQHDCAII